MFFHHKKKKNKRLFLAKKGGNSLAQFAFKKTKKIAVAPANEEPVHAREGPEFAVEDSPSFNRRDSIVSIYSAIQHIQSPDTCYPHA